MFSKDWRKNYHPTPLLRAFQIFLLVLIVTGIVLLCTQPLWLPAVTKYLLAH